MPAFQTLKRKSDSGEESIRKRVAVEADGEEHYWVVQWRNYQAKKHKTWDGDGVLVVSGFKSTLYDSEGKTISSGKRDPAPYTAGRNMVVGGKDIELDRAITRAEYLSGTCFGDGASYAAIQTTSTSKPTALSKQFVPLKIDKSSTPLHVQASTGGSERRIVPLQPVDLLSTLNNKSPKKTLPSIKVEDSYWTANWRKSGQNKKHKTWDGDAFVSKIGGKLTMMTEEGKMHVKFICPRRPVLTSRSMGTTPWKGDPLHSGYFVYIGGKEVELDCEVSLQDLPAVPGGHADDKMAPAIENPAAATSASIGSPTKTFVAPTSFYGPQAASKAKPKGPLHDPTVEGAVVMKAPTKEHIRRFNKKELPIVAVVLDPILAPRMRAHQIEGVKFMYECVMGLRKHEGQGCILADEMGLGKTLQTISLIWTLLRQNPYAGAGPIVSKVLIVCPVSLVNNWKVEFHKWLGRDRLGVVACDKDKNVIKTFQHAKTQHVLIIGYERLRTVMQVDNEQLAYCVPPIGLIVCDEGHRLKSANNKTTAMFDALRTTRRIILSGTPIQNDLGEFHAMADFCNPGLLDNYATFRRVYEVPILNSRAPDSSAKEREVGEARSAQLLTIAKSFVLRRDATLLQNYLPPKHEYVVFITPTRLQLSIFSKILNPDKLDDLARSSTAESLALIGMLTKVSNSPILLKATADKEKAAGGDVRNAIKRAGVEEALKLLPENAQIEDVSLSGTPLLVSKDLIAYLGPGKLTALAKLLKAIYQNTEEKCVLVSHYTSTLNILEAFCKRKSYSFYRLDGQTPAAKRQEYVNSFNKSSQRSSCRKYFPSLYRGLQVELLVVFLLSSKSRRLCLIDSDWNPSHDLQSMARCHRDGQKRPVYIYRFLTAGAIDEKIYQRQVTKLGLSNSLMGNSSSSASSKSDSFSRKDLRDIFRIHPDTVCNTHDLLECQCDGTFIAPEEIADDASMDSDVEDGDPDKKGFVNASQVQPEEINKMDKAYLAKKRAGLAALGQWKHINCLLPTARDDIQDHILRKLVFLPEPEKKASSSKPQSQLLAALDAAVAMAALTVSDLPGGSVSFLFEKSSTVALEDSP
ncbi:SNF2 family N-terminal domain-containing protein [Mycena alexandri]|uniref:SNF2 family N-terminal domain-containing protein n=1 Tax=Mycena alexandri TaxID=1745969 RepID=A0AAD6X794_9AGAR|nr:SNF2 family N-terminal domain-containing protein [Mycena alexandri]